ncbi:MAG TPA: hypothetical protein DHU69_08465 [Deltaproteobacteria bacterium]|nr:MAG: hypothetical protein A2056_00365 [Deltaproteobacteria bacterium GWA2_42_85]OGP40723.1 MAG: hypothetical protein A2090_05970 [Deltaproteobacteria bacterium GWD2_42_10]OGP47263.1 MAG: hypothetical protein A2022_09415 [Deltaproteobacteria bacterium GWF2_42_12]OGQ25167.1 MAG: hypothetical protein A3D29_06825 [Deltaproteobacteria bacterium RIFCSPHIGHO2_02_FULL_42_44]OGQ68866.1 MAG: hypothetical protein A3F88_05260 [Deltaproteobacteria bacterium RIFCSPLOWO2_12_FULL_42_16]HAG51002.1 hypotheti
MGRRIHIIINAHILAKNEKITNQIYFFPKIDIDFYEFCRNKIILHTTTLWIIIPPTCFNEYYNMNKKITTQDGATLEIKKIAVFHTNLSLKVAEELNRRNIYYRVEEIDNYTTALYVLIESANEAEEIINDIKKKFRRIRF